MTAANDVHTDDIPLEGRSRPASTFGIPWLILDDFEDAQMHWCDDGRLMVWCNDYLIASEQGSPSALLRRLADRMEVYEAHRPEPTAPLPWADYVDEDAA